MRETTHTVWQILRESNVDQAATWVYRFVLLALVTLLALNQSTAPSEEILHLTETVMYTGFVIGGFYLIVPPAVEAYRLRRGVDG